MLTKELLQFTIRKGKVRPRFVKTKDEDLVALATDLLQMAEDSVGEPFRDLEEALGSRVNQFKRPGIARGIAKLVKDRVGVEAPDEAALQLRNEAFAAASQAMAEMSGDGVYEDFEAKMAEALVRPLEQVRTDLYADLPDRRRVITWDPLSAAALLDRYNLALAQGLVMYAHRVTVRTTTPDLAVVRRLLRWLKFCRLVAGVRRDDEALVIEAEGPAAVLSSSRKYGLQLAMFMLAVPLLKSYEVEAEVELPRRPKADLHLDHKDPLVSTLTSGLGHVPEELKKIVSGFEEGEWALDALPLLRPVGATGMCVPDFTASRRGGDTEVAVELFHAWHRTMLDRRLAELAERPDPNLLLGVDRSLAKAPEAKARLEAEPQVFLFTVFPTQRVLRRALARFE